MECPWPRSVTFVINRYYDPMTGSFVSVDPDINETHQSYAYAGDDPVDEIDPLGMSWYDPSWVNKAWNDTGGKVVHEIATHTIGICLNVGLGSGAYVTASGCIALAGGHPVLIGVAGGGGSSPTGSVTLGVLISNAQKPCELSGPFGLLGGSGDLGVSVGDEGSIGSASNNKTIWENQVSGGLGLDLPIPVETHGGATYSWVWSP
jgi:hypothetical protein